LAGKEAVPAALGRGAVLIQIGGQLVVASGLGSIVPRDVERDAGGQLAVVASIGARLTGNVAASGRVELDRPGPALLTGREATRDAAPADVIRAGDAYIRISLIIGRIVCVTSRDNLAPRSLIVACFTKCHAVAEVDSNLSSV
jgi:hypothetical protein